MKNAQTIGVVGAGTMGAGIAQACIAAGLFVVLIEEMVVAGRLGRKSGRGFFTYEPK